MTPRVVLCAGLPRSGSTWQFNAARLLHGQAGDVTRGYWWADYDPADPASVHVVKVHGPEEATGLKADVTVATFRDPRAALGSLLRMGWIDADEQSAGDFLTKYLALHAHWQARADLFLRYEDILETPMTSLSRLADTLGLSLTKAHLSNVADALDGLTSPDGVKSRAPNFDKETLLHPGHIGSRQDRDAIEVLPPPIRDFAEREFGSWLDRHGYAADPLGGSAD